MLMHHADAQRKGVLGAPDCHRFFPSTKISPLVRVINAREHVHEGGLAAAVFAQQREDLPLFHGQVDPVVGHHLPEPLGQVAAFDRVLLHCIISRL